MNLAFPDFGDDSLMEFSVCALFTADPPSRLDALPQRSLVQVRYEVAGNAVWARLAIDKTGDHGHVHFDFGREGVYSEKDNFEVKSIQEIGAILDGLNGQVAKLELNAHFAIDFDDLPEHGIITTLCGVSTESCGSTMSLDGASMAIDGDMFYKMRWNRDYESDSVCVELFASSESEIREQYLVDLAEIMRNGLDCFVFETSDKPGTGHDADDDEREGLRHAASS